MNLWAGFWNDQSVTSQDLVGEEEVLPHCIHLRSTPFSSFCCAQILTTIPSNKKSPFLTTIYTSFLFLYFAFLTYIYAQQQNIILKGCHIIINKLYYSYKKSIERKARNELTLHWSKLNLTNEMHKPASTLASP